MSQISAYKDNSISTQSRGRLVVMLYDGAIKFLRQAVVAMKEGDVAQKGMFIARATDIILELDSVLDMEAGGEVATNLRGLYDFMVRHLHAAHLGNDAAMMEEVISLLVELNEGWKAISGT